MVGVKEGKGRAASEEDSDVRGSRSAALPEHVGRDPRRSADEKRPPPLDLRQRSLDYSMDSVIHRRVRQPAIGAVTIVADAVGVRIRL